MARASRLAVLAVLALVLRVCQSFTMHLTTPSRTTALHVATSAGVEAAEQQAGDNVKTHLYQRTLETLDWPRVLESLASASRTVRAKALASDLELAASAKEARVLYSTVEEVMSFGEDVPIETSMDVEAELALVANGDVLDVDELNLVTSTLSDLGRVRKWLTSRSAETPQLRALAEQVVVPEPVVTILGDAFDDQRQLSGKKFPQLAALRKKRDALYQRISSMVTSLIAGELKDAVTDPRVIEIGDRFLVPVKPSLKRGLGIVHDSSRTGKTVYVEPAQVVEPTNELKEVKLELRAEEQQILRQMSNMIAKHRPEIDASLDAIAQVDLAAARAKLGTLINGTIPDVQDQGCIRLTNCRHPVLQLRGSTPVGNDLTLNETTPGLVLTGPNAGGKTVVLKTLGLMALLARGGIPIPAEVNARVDFFGTVLADIGDLQSVGADLSTFSGHLLVCRSVLAEAQAAKNNALVLMDEMGSGTDPAQGVAIAQALLEALIDAGTRTALTTHYLQLKELASSDKRFEVAGMEFVHGRPTYRLQYGFVGESHAISVAERLNLPAPVVGRARELLDDGVRQVSDLIRDLEEQREAARAQADQMAELKRQLQAEKRTATEAREKAEEEFRQARAEAAAEYAREVLKMEEELRVIKQNIRGGGSSLTVAEVGESIKAVQAVTDKVMDDADTRPEPEETPLENLMQVDEGDPVVVLKSGQFRGEEGIVIRKSRNQVQVRVGDVELSLKKHDIGIPLPSRQQQQKKAAKSKPKNKTKRGAPVPKWLAEEEARLAASGKRSRSGGAASAPRGPAVRVSANTLDLRGFALEDAIIEAERFILSAAGGHSTVYLLHGHGTGVLKDGIRRWLPKAPRVKKWKPADQLSGGDAFTEVQCG